MYGEYTDYTRSHHHPGAQFWVGSSRNWSVFLERPNTGRHEKAPVRCPCSRLAALHGAPQTLKECCLSVVRILCLHPNCTFAGVIPGFVIHSNLSGFALHFAICYCTFASRSTSCVAFFASRSTSCVAFFGSHSTSCVAFFASRSTSCVAFFASRSTSCVAFFASHSTSCVVFFASRSTSCVAFFANRSTSCVPFFANQSVLCSFTRIKKIVLLRNHYDT